MTEISVKEFFSKDGLDTSGQEEMSDEEFIFGKSFSKAWQRIERGRNIDQTIPFTGFEKTMAKKLPPWMMGVYGAGKGVVTELSPFPSLMSEGQRQAFKELNQEEQGIAILLNTAEIVAGVGLGKLIGKGIKKEVEVAQPWLRKKFSKGFKQEPEVIKEKKEVLAEGEEAAESKPKEKEKEEK